MGEVIEARAVIAARGAGEDRIHHRSNGTGGEWVVADGAGGMAGGAAAADRADWLLSHHSITCCPDELAYRLSEFDDQLHRDDLVGEVAAVHVAIIDQDVISASVGDCEAWLIDRRDINRMTTGQSRKPLLGSGISLPRPFHTELTPGATLLIGTDGLFKYAAPAVIAEHCAHPDLNTVIDRLVDAVRLPSGGLQDDIAVVAVRRSMDQVARIGF
ncbi:MAG: SpoIIE family protein phosphatase [Planctomycetota bacterium]